MTRTLFALVLTLVLTALPALGQTRTFAASPGSTLDLRLEAGGDLHISGWDRDEVQVEITRSGRDADELDVDMEDRNGRIVIRSQYNSRNARAEVDYDIRVPSRFDVSFWISGGSVTLEGIDGDMDGETMGGEVSLSRLRGELDVTTMGGAISLVNSQTSGRIKTMGGAIELDDVEGDIDATTMGGAITYRNVRPLGKTATRVETMGGDIEVSAAPAGADVNTMGGDISVGTVASFLKARTMGGDIEAREVDGWVEAQTMGGDITVRVVGSGGDRHIELTSLGGDIDLTVPANMGMDVDIELEIRGRDVRADEYRITSNFDLKIDRPSGFEGSGGEREMTVTATGQVNGGGQSVIIRTVNGNVSLRR